MNMGFKFSGTKRTRTGVVLFRGDTASIVLGSPGFDTRLL